MRLSSLDLVALAVYLSVIVALGVWASRRAGRSEESYFVAGRQLPWWLAGVSLIATSFSIDTPLGIAGLVAEHGIPGVWFAWCFAIGGAGLLGYSMVAELWRRSGVLTDAALAELRYDGRGAVVLRLVKGVYFGVVLNALALAWVIKAVADFGAHLLGQPPFLVIAVALTLTLIYSAVGGLWGVVASDLVQYGVILGSFVWVALSLLERVGGGDGLALALGEVWGQTTSERLRFVPRSSDAFFPTFVAYAAVMWWAHKNASAAGPVVQRLVACRDEREARRSTLAFAVGTFAVNYWPMILIALAAIALYPGESIEGAVSQALRDQLSPGLLGLFAAAMLAAFMSTVDSHLNLGASYLVHDVLGRFVRPDASDRERVAWGRLCTVATLALAVGFSLVLDSIAGAWQLMAALTSGYGLVTLVRWFWWRVNAWSELTALAASAAATVVWRAGEWSDSLVVELALVVSFSTLAWLAVTWVTPPTGEAQLRHFVSQVRPWGLWPAGGGAAGLGRRVTVWLLGSVAVLALNFTLGAWVLGRGSTAMGLGALALAAGLGFVVVDRGIATELATAPTPPQRRGEGQREEEN